MARSLICERSFEFARRLVALCDRLWNRGPAARHIATQLMRCGTSVGSNAEEAQGGQTKADFIAKLSISRKEAREAVWWLRLAIATNMVAPQEVTWELNEANQLVAMITSAVHTAQASPERTQASKGPVSETPAR